MTGQPPAPHGQGGFLLSKVHYVSRRTLGSMLRDHGLQEFDPGQGRILFALWQGDGITITQLAERTALQKSTLTRMLDRLEHAGLLRREPDPADRRTTRILLTSQARSALHTFAEVSERMRELFYRGFTQPEIEIFESALERILTNLTDQAAGDPLMPAGHPDRRPVSRGPSSGDRARIDVTPDQGEAPDGGRDTGGGHCGTPSLAARRPFSFSGEDRRGDGGEEPT